MEEFEKEIVETLVPAIISELLLDDKIKQDSSDNQVKQAVNSYLKNEQLELMNVAVTIGSEFNEAIKNAVKLKQNNVAIALAGICLEQMTNEFYQNILINKYGFSEGEFLSCMKSVSVKDKLTWLYKLITSQSINENIVSSVQKVCSLRNNIVHYKPKIERLGKWGAKEETNKKVILNELLPLIENLQNILNDTSLDIFPEDKIAQEIFKKVYKEKGK